MSQEDSLVYVPSLNARVTELRLFERGVDAPGREARTYTNVFSSLTTRFVFWELNLAYPPQPERIDYEIEAVYYKPDGTVFANETSNAYVDQGWTSSSRSQGRGWRSPRQWQNGLYKVELSIDEQEVASGEFEIVDSRIPIEGPFADLRQGLAWASPPWSLEEEAPLLSLAGLMETDPTLASEIASLPWIRDSLTDEESRVIQVLDIMAREDVDLARRVVGFSWLADDVTMDEWLALRTLTLLAVYDTAVAKFIADFDWLNDGITESERKALDALRGITVEHPSLAETLLSLPWLGDQLTEQEGLTIREFRSLAIRHSHLAQQVADMRILDGRVDRSLRTAIWALRKLYDIDSGRLSILSAYPWFKDGLEDEEVDLVTHLGYIGRRSETGVQAIVNMPFLETFEPADALAVLSLRRLADLDNEEGSEHFQRVMDHPAISDGITDEEAKIVATLKTVSQYNPVLVDTLLDPAQVELEERTINLPLAGEVQLTIIRTRPGAKRTMDILENAVRSLEEYMAYPFPVKQVNFLFEDATTGSAFGSNSGINITSKPRADENSYSEQSAFRHIAHETAHYYWRAQQDWIGEGAATFLEPFVTNATIGELIALDKTPCAHAGNIAALESLDAEEGDPAYSCNYSLGERLFHDLYRSLDENAFRRGFRNLYLKSLVDGPHDGCEGDKLGICHVEAAFKADASDEENAAVEKVIARWYHGSVPYDTSHQDTGPVDPNLPSIKGTISQAYIALDKDRREETKTDRFSAAALEDRVHLFLHFSYPRIQDEQELNFDVVEFFEDGFFYRHKSRTARFKAGWDQAWSWFSIGPDPESRQWKPGNYWVYVYHEGRKVAEVEFQVTS